ncbi:RHS repeat-associated core domain-containing protein [Robbsia sp. KACC 23696]|uniref:RHS repeat-associated core domain-containing protein n=1 Tax=Robbsia sp. KACC 23696 TaxID=3149231 RepID=UPI00325BC49D
MATAAASAGTNTAAPAPAIYGTVALAARIPAADAGDALHRIDEWLREISAGYLTLDRVKTAANVIPVVSNILAAADVILDIRDIAMSKESPGVFDWLNLGIDLIGVIAVAGGGEVRMAARPLLHLARENVLRLGKDAAQAGVQLIGDAVIEMLVAHLQSHFQGEIEAFLQALQGMLQGFLSACADKAQEIINALAQVFEDAADPEHSSLLAAGQNQKASEAALDKASKAFDAHNPRAVASGLFHYLAEGATALVKEGGQKAASLAGPPPAEVVAMLKGLASSLRQKGPLIKQKILALNGNDVGELMWLMQILQQSVQMWRRRKHKAGSVVGILPSGTAKVEEHRPDGALEHVRGAKEAKGAGAGCPAICEIGAVSGSGGSISYALGFERFSHEDFTIPGALPIVWERTYHSRLESYDDGDLGARWTTPFSTRIDERSTGALQYHDALGRTLFYPALAVEATHEDLTESLTLTRESADWLVVKRGSEMTEAYERRGAHYRLAYIQMRNGTQVVLDYDAKDRLSRLGYAEGVLGFRHDASGRIAEILQFDRNGEPVGTHPLARYQYDAKGDLVVAFDRYGNRRDYTYQHHLVTRYTDRTGRGITLEWDGTNASARCVRECADDGSLDIRLHWHDDMRLTEVSDASGARTLYWYDIDGYVYRVQQADGKEEWLHWNKHHWLTQRVFADGSRERYEYDARGNRTRTFGRTGDVTEMRYDDKDQVVALVDPVGGHWLREYDDVGNVVVETDPLERKTQYQYDGAGRPTTIVDAKGGTKKLAYDASGNLIRYTDCSSKTTQWKYDDAGRLLETRDATDGLTQYAYGTNGQLASVATPAGVERVQYDAEARLLEHEDGLARITRYDYDAAGRIRVRRDALGQTLSYSYDRQGRLSSLVDPNGAQYRFAYDPVGRLLEEVGFDSIATEYRYDEGTGRLKEIEEAGRTTGLIVDAAGRVTQRGDAKFAYDQAGRLAYASNEFSKTSHFYDAVGNLIREHHAYSVFGDKRSYVWRHEYDALDNRIASVRPDGHRVDWLRYGSGHVHGMLIDGAEHVQIERDDLHRETSRTLANRITQNTRYDEAGRLHKQTLTRGGMPSAFAVREYRYDRAGQLTHIQDSRRGEIAYRYDPVGRLLEANGPLGRERFAFDPASNIVDLPNSASNNSGNSLADAYARKDLSGERGRGREENSFGAEVPKVLGNLLKGYAGTHYEYDAHGNLAMKTSPRGQQRYEWDGFDRLVRADVAETGRRHQARYFYDAFSRRIAKDVDGEQTVFGWDGDRLAFETMGAGSTHYLYEAETFVPLAQYRAAAVSGIETPTWQPGDRYVPESDPLMQPPSADGDMVMYYYQCDQIGTPHYLSDARGDIAVEMSYKAWGEAREVISDAAKAAGITNPLRFQGQYFDAETGAHYNRYRYYDPNHGRFITKDPIGLFGGVNAYLYAPNHVEWIDPLGLARLSLPGSRPGKDFTKAGKAIVKRENAESNGGLMTCTQCGEKVLNGAQHQSGVTPPNNEAHVDHIQPKSKGGSGTPENGQVLCRVCNLDKSNTW